MMPRTGCAYQSSMGRGFTGSPNWDGRAVKHVVVSTPRRNTDDSVREEPTIRSFRLRTVVLTVSGNRQESDDSELKLGLEAFAR